MKIGPNFNVFQITSGLRTKRNDSDGGAARQQYDPNQSKHDQKNDGHGSPDQAPSAGPARPGLTTATEILPEQVQRAIESFRADATTIANGLKASLEGQGADLKIVLTDINGAVLRHFSGEEFLRLRAATGGSLPRSGKLLDQKL